MNTETKQFFTIETYNRRKWSDKYSCTYSTLEEAEDCARHLHKNCEDTDPIHTSYRIKHTLTTTTIIELQ